MKIIKTTPRISNHQPRFSRKEPFRSFVLRSGKAIHPKVVRRRSTEHAIVLGASDQQQVVGNECKSVSVKKRQRLWTDAVVCFAQICTRTEHCIADCLLTVVFDVRFKWIFTLFNTNLNWRCNRHTRRCRRHLYSRNNKQKGQHEQM